MIPSVALLTAAVLVSLAALGLLLHGPRHAGSSILMGVVGVTWTLATVAAARRLEAAAQFWILVVVLVALAEFALLRRLQRARASDDEREAEDA